VLRSLQYFFQNQNLCSLRGLISNNGLFPLFKIDHKPQRVISSHHQAIKMSRKLCLQQLLICRSKCGHVTQGTMTGLSAPLCSILPLCRIYMSRKIFSTSLLCFRGLVDVDKCFTCLPWIPSVLISLIDRLS
jgi:hypothetical protein